MSMNAPQKRGWPVDATLGRPPLALRQKIEAEARAKEDAARKQASFMRAAGREAAHRTDIERKRHEHRVRRLKRLHAADLALVGQIVELHADVYAVSVDDILFARHVPHIESAQDSVIFHMISEGVPQRAIECAMGMGWKSVKAAFGRHISRMENEQ